MGYRVLHDEALHTLRVCQYHAETDGPALVLHVKRVARQTHRLREILHHRSDMIEGVIRRFLPLLLRAEDLA